MPTGTPLPTTDELEARAKNNGMRPVRVWDTALYIVEKCLPDYATRMNTTAKLALPPLGGYIVAGETAEKLPTPYIVAGASVNFNPLAPRVQEGHVSLVLFCNYGVTMTRSDCDNSMDYATLMYNLMASFQKGFCDAKGQMVWTRSTPQGIMPAPADWKNYRGWGAHFDMVQDPNQDLWTRP